MSIPTPTPVGIPITLRDALELLAQHRSQELALVRGAPVLVGATVLLVAALAYFINRLLFQSTVSGLRANVGAREAHIAFLADKLKDAEQQAGALAKEELPTALKAQVQHLEDELRSSGKGVGIVPPVVPPVSGPSTRLELAEKAEPAETRITPQYLASLRKDRTKLQAETLINRHLGEPIEVSGRISEIVPLFPSSPGPLFASFQHEDFDDVSVYMIFNQAWADRLAVLKRGDRITVVGKLDKVDYKGDVTVRECEVTEFASPAS